MRDPNNGEWLPLNVCVALLSCLSSCGSSVVKATYESVYGTNVFASLQRSCIFQRKIHKCSRSLKFVQNLQEQLLKLVCRQSSAGLSCIYSSGSRCAFVFIVLSYTFRSPPETPSRMSFWKRLYGHQLPVRHLVLDGLLLSYCFLALIVKIEENNRSSSIVKWIISTFSE